MRWLAILGLVLVTSCSSKGSQAEKRYDIVARTHNSTAQCAEADKVAMAYLDDGNEAKYREWLDKRKDDCAMARLESIAS